MESNIAQKMTKRPLANVLQALLKLTHLTPKERVVYCPSPISSLATVGNTNFWHMTVIEPISAQRCSFRRTLYTTQTAHSSTNSTAQISSLEADFRALSEQLEQQYRDILAGTDSIVLSSSQEDLRRAVQEHSRKERRSGRRISPARPLEIASEVNSSSCGVAEKCKMAPGVSRAKTNNSCAVCRELDALADATSCLGVGSMAQGLAW